MQARTVLEQAHFGHLYDAEVKMQAFVKGMEKCLNEWENDGLKPLSKDLPTKH